MLRPGESYAAQKAMANYLVMSYAKNNHDRTPGSPMLRLSVGLSVGAHWRQQFTCPTIHVLKYYLSFVRAHTKSATCRSVGAILCVLHPGLTSAALLDKGKGGAIT
ncbi:hypothetical protein PoB_000814600 [Plakobranchus ocellatus]|uniref:Uncharacterized protein n=1 Tax=Plakobranchus ocellatus TaxID=259542 RepID=A0AAV3YH01_9GAST|nr:hypothetical protein PoB_000814600 [Plakobranchus ocellatus]